MSRGAPRICWELSDDVLHVGARRQATLAKPAIGRGVDAGDERRMLGADAGYVK